MILHPGLCSQPPALRTGNALIGQQCHVEIMLRLTQELGGLLPDLPESIHTGMHHVLTIGCGTGPWTREMARTHPEQTIVGLDRNPQNVQAANQWVQAHRLRNVWHMQTAYEAETLPFPDASFDLVAAHFLSRWLTSRTWATLLRECLRVLRPGGTLFLLESEAGCSNAPAHAALWRLFVQARRATQRSFSPSDCYLGLVGALEAFLAEAGFSQPHLTEHSLSYGSEALLHEEWTSDLHLLAKAMLPRLVALGLTTREQGESLLRQQQIEMHFPTFRAVLPILSVWATKPTIA